MIRTAGVLAYFFVSAVVVVLFSFPAVHKAAYIQSRQRAVVYFGRPNIDQHHTYHVFSCVLACLAVVLVVACDGTL